MGPEETHSKCSLPLSGINAGTNLRIWSDKCFAKALPLRFLFLYGGVLGALNGFQGTAAHRAGSIQNLWAHQLKWKCWYGWEGEEAGAATQTSGWCPISHICLESLPQLKPRCSGPSPAGWQWQGENVGPPATAHVKNAAHRWQPMCSDSCMEGLAPFFSSLPLIALCPAALQLWRKESQHEKDIFKVMIYIWNSTEQLKLRWGRGNDCLCWNPASLSVFLFCRNICHL